MVCRSKLYAVIVYTGVEARSEFDSHVNTCMLGTYFIVLNNIDMKCKLHPYPSDYDPNIVILVNAVADYDHSDGKTYILRVNQDLEMLDEDRGVLFLTQMRSNELIVEECPFSF